MKPIYAMYKGDRFIATGTAEELAEIRWVKPKSIRNLLGDYYRRKVKNKENRLMIIRIGEE